MKFLSIMSLVPFFPFCVVFLCHFAQNSNVFRNAYVTLLDWLYKVLLKVQMKKAGITQVVYTCGTSSKGDGISTYTIQPGTQEMNYLEKLCFPDS